MQMKTLNLRQAIIQRVQDKSEDDLLEVINSSIESDERALPGMGVLFEIIWKHIDEKQQNKLISVLKNNLADKS